jgi:transcriptional regulator of arginine metabolism
MASKKRIQDIVNILNTKKISSQRMLLEELKSLGYNVTQSTISRDLKKLRLIKKRNLSGEEFYAIDNNVLLEKKVTNFDKLILKFKENVVSIKNTNNIIVIKTYPGEAQGVAATIDSMNFEEILGTVAGDDTIICIADNVENTKKLTEIFKNF